MAMEKRVFGQKINFIRKSKKITSEQLAEMCDVNAGHIRQVEAGLRSPSLELLVDICNSLNVSPEYLLSQDLYQLEDYDGSYNKIIKKLNKLSPQQLDILDYLLEAYILKTGICQ